MLEEMTDEKNQILSAIKDSCCKDTDTLFGGIGESQPVNRILRLEFADFSKLDDTVQTAVYLYLYRAELGRGLYNVELRNEDMLLQLLNSWGKIAISKMENINKTNFVLIKGFLKVKYCSEKGVTRRKENELVSVSESLRWLKERKGAETVFNPAINQNNSRSFSLDMKKCLKLRKYDLLVNELDFIYKRSVEIIPYGMTWATVETLSSYRRRRLDLESLLIGIINNMGLKSKLKTKYDTHILEDKYSEGYKININQESDLEKDNEGLNLRNK
ncbi:hypothetical protein CWI38_0010p0030 [Hamiltosporidium tvaerminnensis]|uniref:Uncharacterized protein n=1 Tax=Hamiltosporidium tvaerminnensis TaxID=1176355 RepID=A0A4Q9M4H8_9MICR|nr:hypothetical protein CWI38_0010p0030 [Hamiltosporidium tvaerminnensis]